MIHIPIELLQRGNEARRGQTQGLVIRASRAVYCCLLTHAGPTKGGASKRPTTAAASRPRRGRQDMSSVAGDPCSLAEAIHCRSAQTFGFAEGPSRAVRDRTRLPRLTAEQASAPPTLGRPNLAPRWPWGCAANGSRSILSRVGTIMDGPNDEKSPGKPRTLSGTRARPARKRDGRARVRFARPRNLLNFGGGCPSKIQRNEGLCM